MQAMQQALEQRGAAIATREAAADAKVEEALQAVAAAQEVATCEARSEYLAETEALAAQRSHLEAELRRADAIRQVRHAGHW